MCKKSKKVLHVEERDLSSEGLLEALNSIAAHNEIFLYYTKEETQGMIGAMRQELGPLLVNDHTNAQILDVVR